MTTFQALLGETLTTQNGTAKTEEVLADAKAVALYFSAHWCPPCRGFTPELAKWYTDDLKAKGLEVVFVSSDKDEDAFKSYFGEMPWTALPFADRERKESLSSKYGVEGIPTLVILDAQGNIINKNARNAVSSDPTGEDFPWKPQSLQEIMVDAKLVGGAGDDGTKTGKDLVGKVYAFYFSAHWCPPCRGFTPQFAKWYTDDLKAKGLEVVFVSSDKDDTAFLEYFGEQPWLALDFADRKRKGQLSELFGVSGIPSVVLIDADGSVITKEARGAISADPTGESFPWYPKPVRNLASGPGSINSVPTVLAFCETQNAIYHKAVEAAMTPIAERYISEAKESKEDDPAIAFTIVTSSEGLAPRLRSMFSMPTLPPAVHEHSLEKKAPGGGWGSCSR